jgi:hypothetical protein
MSFLNDRYILIASSVTVILLVCCFVPLESEEDEEKTIIGIISDVKDSKKGFVFVIEDISGIEHRCFSDEEPEEMTLCKIKGRQSSDGGIFFVSSFVR